MLVNKNERCLTQNYSTRELDALKKNRYQIQILDDTLNNLEQEFEKNNSKLRKSINCTIQSFQIIKSSTGSRAITIQDSRNLNSNYQTELESYYNNDYLVPQVTPEPFRGALKSSRTKRFRMNKFAKMKPILSEKDLKYIERLKCDPNLTEWNKFKLKQSLNGADINLKKFQFIDRDLYNNYLDQIDQFDNLISIRPFNTNSKNNKDSIYFKQHRELLKAKSSDTTPVFGDYSSHFIKPVISRQLKSKLMKQEFLINEFNLKPNNNNTNQKLKKTNDNLADRVKEFLRNI